ncbi:hypothetical protein JG688_00001741 [Phytophthora aleatoria]|uniref:Uncharacterized protein n=1 Tax=Phytophthora aleatoria TaxID=2496075 RepID=A0A8J5MD51_9STRA|nr:hypothetical protein JG688_00001741 [Phytophthora aleatoria]
MHTKNNGYILLWPEVFASGQVSVGGAKRIGEGYTTVLSLSAALQGDTGKARCRVCTFFHNDAVELNVSFRIGANTLHTAFECSWRQRRLHDAQIEVESGRHQT